MNTKNSLKNIIKKLNNKTEKYKNASIVIFGTASCGNMAYNCIKSKEKKISAFIDNNEANNNKIIIDNIKCFTPETYISDTQENHIYVIATGNHLYKLLKEQTENLLKKYNKNGIVLTFNEYAISENFDSIKTIYNLLEDKESKKIYTTILLSRLTNDDSILKTIYEPVQYFCLPEMCQSGMANEIFVDCGAYVGDTIEKYLFYCGYLFKRIYAFEPGEKTFKALKIRSERLKQEWALDDNQILCINKGLGDTDKKMYLAKGTIDIGGSFVKNEYSDGNSECEICSIDNTINEAVNFIKADVEGYELKMLQGAKEHIKKYKPKLAISIYHSPYDLFEIAEYIKTLVPEYKFKIRHHSTCFYETVLYCYI